MMKNSKYIGYDETKKMLNVLRNFKQNMPSKTIKEQEERTPEMSENPNSDFIVINDVEVTISSTDEMDMKLTDEQKTSISNLIDNFRQQVTNLVEFDPGMTIAMDQVRLDGIITDFEFRFTLVAGKDPGLYVVCDMTEVNTELLDILTKFNKFYQTYVDAMNNVIAQRKNN